MYLHFVDDISQINHLIIRTNEMFQKEHKFYVITDNGEWTQTIKANNVKPFIPTKGNIREVVREISNYKAVFIHNLCFVKAKIVLQAPEEIPFVWGVWGFDYYYVFPKLMKGIYLPWTKAANLIMFKHFLFFKKVCYYLHPITCLIGIPSHSRIRIKASEKIKYTFNNLDNFSDCFKVIKSNRNSRFKGIYYSVESLSKGIENFPKKLGKNIFIGNSASNSSNHIDIFARLKKIDFGSRKIIVPLSYGCWRYGLLVNCVGKCLFKKNFFPLKRYLPLNEYNEILFDCNVMIFNHNRAQALGNIIFGVWAGHKIFLRKMNPIFKYFKSIGIIVFSIDEELIGENLNALEKETQMINRQIIEAHYNEKRIRENYLEIINAINLKCDE